MLVIKIITWPFSFIEVLIKSILDFTILVVGLYIGRAQSMIYKILICEMSNSDLYDLKQMK